MAKNLAAGLLSRKGSPLTATLMRGLALFYLVLLATTFAGIVLNGGTFMLATDHVLLLLFSVVIILEKGGDLLVSFSKYFIIFLSYMGMRGYADNVNPNVDYLTPILFDRMIGGGALPTGMLQEWLAQFTPFVDLAALSLYVLHFFFPFLFGILVWFRDKKLYEPYFIALLLTSYLGLTTFLAFPVAPPWMAAEAGIIDIDHLTIEKGIEYRFTMMPSIYSLFNANPVAAFPSLHFAYPVLIAYFALRLFGRLGTIFLLYPLLMGLSLVYLGEHYVVDLLGGAAYAFCAVMLSGYIVRSLERSPLQTIYRMA